MCVGFCLSQIPATCQRGSPLTQQDKRVQLWETKSQSSLGAQPGGDVCFGCRLLNEHCLPFLFPFLKCLDLGAFESCPLVTLHAHKCFSMTWERPFPDEWGSARRKIFSNFIILTAPDLHPCDLGGHTGHQGTRASLNEDIPLMSSFLIPLSSRLPSHLGLQSNGHLRKHIRTLGLCESGSLGCKVNCSFHQDKDIQMWERIKFLPLPWNQWLS